MRLLSKLSNLLFKPFSRATLLRVSCLLFPTLLLICGSKFYKFGRLYDFIRPAKTPFSAIELYPLLRWDLAFVIVSSLLFLLWIDRFGGKLRKVGLYTLHLSAFLCAFIYILDLSTFVFSGTQGNWLLYKYAFLRPTAFLEIFSYQRNPLGFWLLLAFILVNLFPIFLEKRSFVQKWMQKELQHGFFRQTYPMLLGIIAILALFLLTPDNSITKRVGYLSKNTFLKTTNELSRDLLKNVHRYLSKHRLPFDTRHLTLWSTPKTQRMNVVFVLLESVRADATTMHNPVLQTTPFMNELSKKSLFIEKMYPVTNNNTKALVSSLCGIYPKFTKSVDESQKNGIPGNCLAKLLSLKGYETGFFQTSSSMRESRGQLVKNMGYRHFFHGGSIRPQSGFKGVNRHGYEDKAMLKPSFKWIDKATKDGRPFFATYKTITTHYEYQTPKNFKKKSFVDHNEFRYNDYLNAVHYTDSFIKELMEGFKKRGLSKSTIFVIAGTYGEAFNEHKKRFHEQGLWEEMLHVPAMIYAPRLFKKHDRIHGLHQQIDLVPTTLDLLNYNARGGHFAGTSILSTEKETQQIFYSCRSPNRCIAKRVGSTKYIFHPKSKKWTIYNLRLDPAEKSNLAKKKKTLKAKEKKLKKIQQELILLKEQVNDLYETPTPRALNKAISMIQPKVEVTLNIRFGNYIKLVGYNLITETVRPNQKAKIEYIFQCLRKVPKEWSLFFHGQLFNPRRRFLNLDHSPIGSTYPLHKWVPGQYIRDKHQFWVPQGRVRPGMYIHIRMGMWAPKKGRQPVLEAYGRPHKSNSLFLVEIPIVR